MNYGRESIKKESKRLNPTGVRVANKIKVWLFKFALVGVLCLVVMGCFFTFGIYKGIIDSSPDINAMDATPTGYLSTVLDSKGNEIASLVASGSNRVYVTIDEIPEDLQHAFVAIEDERFYEHNGIDVKGIIRAGINGLLSGRFNQGASTITQQLLKNNVFTTWTTDKGFSKVVRKLQEQYLAVSLEKKVNDKNWILENYLNTVNLSQNCLGVQAASKRYFNKDVSELTLSECAVIAGITQRPEALNPIKYPENNAERREKVLEKMKEQGYITDAQYEKAMADNVYDRIQTVNMQYTEEKSYINSYFVDALTDSVLDALKEKFGYTDKEANRVLYNSGLTIVSTQDPDIQKICDEEVNNLDNYIGSPKVSFTYRLSVTHEDGSVNYYDENTLLAYYRQNDKNYSLNYADEETAQAAIDAYRDSLLGEGDYVEGELINFTLQPQTALTVIDQSTGEVKAIVGGRGDKNGNRTLNRAVDSTRQPGSCFKVLAAYAPALDAGGKTLASVQEDAPFTYYNGTPVHNYNNAYEGYTNYRRAITQSMNIVTVKASLEIGVDLGYEYLQKFGFTTLSDTDRVQSLALGGITEGVTNLELTAAYATIANKGTYIKPRFFTQILDHDGNVIIDNTPEERTVLKESTAWLLTSAMKDVITQGTSTICAFPGMAQAGKSGTTTKNRDCLFAGYTPYYTCVVWGGYDDNTSVASGTTSYPKRVWRAVMSRIHEGMEYKDFEMPSNIVTATVCKKSGLLAVDGLCDCDPRGSMVYTEYFEAGTEPTEYCDKHVSVTICKSSKQLAGPYCPSDKLVKSVYIRDVTPGSGDAAYAYSDSENERTVCQKHKPVYEAIDIEGTTGPDDEQTYFDDDDPYAGSDSHIGVDDNDYVFIEPGEFSD
ncbi:MAG: PBP1A family penicillin-binding protein [Lachnospiraceae bacterium]|nr:PBP1A family penicillin-binding protein [Lachnospiraceae bacterium]